MLRNRFLVSGTILLVCAGVMGWRVIRRGPRTEESESVQILRDVVVARQTIPEWSLITPEMIELRRVNVASPSVPKDVLTSLEAVQGKVARTELLAGRPIAARDLLGEREVGLAAKIPPGKRAVTIQVGDTAGVSGFLRPGDRVDVLGVFTAAGGAATHSSLLLQDIQVVAVGKSLDQKPAGATPSGNLVTLAVTPQEAARLALAQTRASIQLALRPLAERREVATAAVATPPVVIQRAPSSPKRARARSGRTAARRARSRSTATSGIGLAPAPLPQPQPELIYPVVPPVPPRAPTRQEAGDGPAQPSAPTPSHTVEVIRGTRRETVTLRVTESTGALP